MTKLLKNGEGYEKLHEYYLNKFDLLNGKTNFKEEDFVIPKKLMTDIIADVNGVLSELQSAFANYIEPITPDVNVSNLLYDNLSKLENCLHNIYIKHFRYEGFYEEIYDFIIKNPYKYVCVLKTYSETLFSPEHNDVLKDLKSICSPKYLPAGMIAHFEYLYKPIVIYNKMESVIEYAEKCDSLKDHSNDFYMTNITLDYIIHYREKLLVDLYEDIKNRISRFEYNDTSKNEVRKLLFLLKVTLFEKNWA